MSDSIFDLHNEYVMAIAELEQYCLENDTDEMPDHIRERLYVNDNEVKDKLENYQRYIQALDGKILVIDEEIQRLEKVRASKERVKKRLKILIGFAVNQFGRENKSGTKYVETDFYKFTFIKSPKAQINDLTKLPDEYVKPEIKIKLDDIARAEKLIEALTKKGIEATVDRKPRLKDIADALKDDESKVIPGATLDKENGYIRIS